MAHQIIVLWTTPRSRSTAFERMMIERADHTVLDEPFSARYYFSTERRSNRFEPEEPEATGAQVLAEILSVAEYGPVFVKDMAYHATGLLSEAFLAHFTNTFLIREPDAAIASLQRKWPDFTDEESGYRALGEAFDLAVGSGAAPVVIDGDDLATQPEEVVSKWCEAVGVPFIPEALSWEPGLVPQWTRWQDWYTGVANSSGFMAPVTSHEPASPAGPSPAHDDRNLVLAAARSVYRRMAKVRLRV